MQTCGFYDESGGLLIVGLPGKSGIGGCFALYPILSLPLGLLDLTEKEIQSLECTLESLTTKTGMSVSDKKFFIILKIIFFMIGKSKSIQNFF
jgi:Leucine-rich repeat (LRR) protein